MAIRNILAAHKLGNSQDAANYTRRVGVKSIKLASSMGDAPEFAGMAHDMLIIGRNVVDGGAECKPIDLYRAGRNPLLEAKSYFDAHLRYPIMANTLVHAWEGPNEPVVDTDNPTESLNVMGWYAAFSVELARLIRSMGKRAVVGGFAVGNPGKLPGPYTKEQLDSHIKAMWLAYWPAIESVVRSGDFFHLHEYTVNKPESVSYLQFRYRRLLELTRARGLHLPLLITEFGADYLPDGGQPWDIYYANKGGLPVYAADCADYVAEASKDSEVKFIYAFTFGTNGGRQWNPHNVDGRGFIDAWLKAYQDKARAEAATNPVPTPTPAPAPVVQQWQPTHEVITGGLNIRAAPWTTAAVPDIVLELSKGARVRVLETRGDWGQIAPSGGMWIRLTGPKPATPYTRKL